MDLVVCWPDLGGSWKGRSFIVVIVHSRGTGGSNRSSVSDPKKWDSFLEELDRVRSTKENAG